VRGLLVLLFLLTLRPVFGTSAADVDREIQQIALDPGECYRVLELSFAKEDLKIYLTSGYLIFSKPINGVRLGAVFVASSEAGDAEVLLLPPTRGERLSLANFTGEPNLEEHFKVAAFIFTDGTGDQLLARVQADPAPKKSPEMGGLIAEQYTSVVRNLTGSFETRLVYDLLSGARGGGLFYLAVSGSQLGNFDVLYDPTAQDQIVAGKLSYRNNRTFFDIWTSFPARSFRDGATPHGVSFALDNFRIDAAIDTDLSMKAVTRATLTLKQLPGAAIPLSLSRNMHVTAASVDGQPVEVFERESLRANLISGADDRQFLLVCANPLDPARPHEIEIHHEGSVIRGAGGDVFFVGARGTWYPHAGGEFTNYDLTFRYPKNLTLVATGRATEDRTDGDWRISHSQTEAPIRFAGFNLGDFQSMTVEKDGYKIDLYSNRKLDKAAGLKASSPSMPPPMEGFPRRRRRDVSILGATEAPAEPDAGSRISSLAKDVADTMAFMTEQFGPTPIRNLAITPIPGGFGQGFPGLVYLSTLSYLNPGQLPVGVRERNETTFYTELLETHEVAHQWWGNLVISASYHDEWLMESLANYSALLLLEKKKGIKAVDSVLDGYRNHLLTKTETGRALEEAGPITWGLRLESSLAPDAWRTVTYEKGTWIVHMLRRRLGDQKFLALLREVCNRYRFKAISTEQFRELAQQYMPPTPDPALKTFFENWVYGTGIPSVKLTYSLRGLKLTGTLTQDDVDDNFTALVPVEIQTGRQKSVYWFATGGDPVSFSIPVKMPPSKVSLLTADCLVRTSK
jgi:hypothetical protein